MVNGKPITLPLTRGTGKNPLIARYITLLPVNMLAVPPKLVTANGFLHSFPGIEKKADVDGVSRGALLNVADSLVYRVCGAKLYKGPEAVADIPNTDRVSMASSNQSVAVATGGLMIIRKSDGSTVNLDNWPPSQYFPGSAEILQSGSKGAGYDGTLQLTQSMVDKGRIKLTLTPEAGAATGAALDLDKIQQYYDQEPASAGTPYITDAYISGFDISGTSLTVSYTFNANGAEGDDNTQFVWQQVVEPTSLENAQYDIGEVADICHANGRYAWVKKGTNLWGVTDIDDETKPDRYRPFMTAEAYADPIIGIAEIGGDVAVFGTVSTEFFTLTGSSSTTTTVYRSQKAMLINVGIAGPHCKALADGKFAVISNPAGGRPSVYLLGDGRATEIATPEITDALTATDADELAKGVVQFFRYAEHALIVVRFASSVYCYDLVSKSWCQLAAGNGDEPHPAIDVLQEGVALTAGDIRYPRTGTLRDTTAAQYGETQPHILYSPLMNMPGARLFNLQLEVATGLTRQPEHIAVAATTDGAIFPREVTVRNDEPQRYDLIPCLNRVGFVKHNIGFRFRILSTTPLTVNSASVRPG
ncbi:packaged DNA stabilization protein [Lelliottia wanjuensis]|uniref:Packaged DNA stabilization protein n=1 Tax=Lelliottia wanjuensis TaxID=3050585 RepID=A0AAP4FW39_9ENTR|nr:MULTISPECIES: packaged DNA stabilization protein [unclassified Lelliottia]MDK9364174.1 packaged DNA stabilization protein [Lelliottia sp. V106_12]MDK9617149.1 packaged DNA stabilization protein [Lelliottia sp. V106_9]